MKLFLTLMVAVLISGCATRYDISRCVDDVWGAPEQWAVQIIGLDQHQYAAQHKAADRHDGQGHVQVLE